MAVPNPFRRRTENTRSAWGYVFELTPEHPTPEQMNPLKYTYDKLADDCLDILDSLSPVPSTDSSTDSSSPKSEKPGFHKDYYTLLSQHHASHPTLQTLWTQLHTTPPWVKWPQLSRGQSVFYRYGSACLTGLAFHSLLGGMGAGRVVETLAKTGAFSTRAARRRLYETTQHILQVTQSLDAIKPGGDGWVSSVRVRLLHAAVRRRVVKLAAESAGYYDIKENGVPINDLDSIATIATFSSTLIWQSLPRQGIFLRRAEIEDYLALWRYVAYLLGCPDEQFATPDKALKMMEFLILHEIVPSPQSGVLANNIVSALSYTPPIYASPSMLVASARWLNGHALCDALALPRPGLYYYALMAGQCLFFMAMTYPYRYVPGLDGRKQVWLRKAFWAMIVERKDGLAGREAKYEFKWVPRLGKGTAQEGPEVKDVEGMGIERRNLKTLLWAVAAFLLVAWIFSRLIRGLLWGGKY